MHIAILEDDPDQRALLELWAHSDQHTCVCFGTVEQFITAVRQTSFDLLLIDWMLPDGSGADTVPWVRNSLGWKVPVVVVTALEDESTVVTALRMGADDYLVKPLKRLELLARLANVVRRVNPDALQVLRLGDYEIDITAQRVKVQGNSLALTQKEFDLTVYLFQTPGKLLSREHLLNKIWGIRNEIDTRTVDTHISRLRKKLGLDGSHGWKLTPVYGYGYRFDRAELLEA